MSAGLRVLFLGLRWPPETFIMRLIDGLGRRGVAVTVATRERPAASARVGWQPAGGAGPLRRWRSARPSVAGYDVLYFPWNTAAIAHEALLTQVPSVISCRGSQINVAPHNPERAAIRAGMAATFAKAAAVHCVSAQIRDEATRYGLDPRKATIIHPAVDPNVFIPSPLETGPLVPSPLGRGPLVPSPFGRGLGRGSEESDTPLRLITTGSIIWRKGYEYALMAVRELLDRGINVHFDILGDGPETQRLLYTIDDLALQDHVTRHGPQPPDEVLRRLQVADVFLLTSLSEGISNAVLEAMACGLPVVTTAVDGMTEAITDGVEGFLVPDRDPATTAGALARLAAAPDLRRAMGDAGRRRVARDFALDNQIDAFVNLFQGVAR